MECATGRGQRNDLFQQRSNEDDYTRCWGRAIPLEPNFLSRSEGGPRRSEQGNAYLARSGAAVGG
jgi:hypothetical protein